jgi:ubiquinone/menaquinone biosynthesis C-methylase UbiE
VYSMTKLPLDWDNCKKRVSNFNLTEDSLILDIGSNDGAKTHYITNKGQVIMCDISKSKSQISPFVLCDGASLPFKDNSFELLTLLHVIEHIKNDKMLLKEMYRVLKKDGVALIVTPNANRFTKLYSIVLKVITRSPYRYPLNIDHVFEYSDSDIKGLLENSEFERYKIDPFYMKISRYLRIRKYCDQWIVTAKKS